MKRGKKLVSCCCLVAALWADGMAAVTAAPADTVAQVRIDRSTTVPVKKTGRAEFTFHADFPSEASRVLADNMTEWVAVLLSELTGVALPDSTVLQYSDQLTAYYEKAYLQQSDDAIRKELKRRGKAGKSPVNYVAEMKVTRKHETRHLITYCAEAYKYGGDAHGTTYTRYASFRKRDGRLLSWNDVVAPASRTRFSSLVTDGIKAYYGMTNIETLCSRLVFELPDSRQRFPVPVSGPGFMADGLHVQLLYGMTPYATGAPSAIIPYSRLRSLLTTDAKQLLK